MKNGTGKNAYAIQIRQIGEEFWKFSTSYRI